MVDAPERIWAYADTDGIVTDYKWTDTSDGGTEYVRTDLYEQVKRTNIGLHDEVQFMRNAAKENREAAERLAGARVVPDEMVKSITDFIREDVLPSYGIESEVGRNDPELFSAVRTALSALAKPAGEAEPVTFQFRYEVSPDTWTEWQIGTAPEWLRKSKTMAIEERPLYAAPPDASAIREALPATGPYVDRLIRIFRDRPADDTSAVVLQDYARAALAGAKP